MTNNQNNIRKHQEFQTRKRIILNLYNRINICQLTT